MGRCRVTTPTTRPPFDGLDTHPPATGRASRRRVCSGIHPRKNRPGMQRSFGDVCTGEASIRLTRSLVEIRPAGWTGCAPSAAGSWQGPTGTARGAPGTRAAVPRTAPKGRDATPAANPIPDDQASAVDGTLAGAGPRLALPRIPSGAAPFTAPPPPTRQLDQMPVGIAQEASDLGAPLVRRRRELPAAGARTDSYSARQSWTRTVMVCHGRGRGRRKHDLRLGRRGLPAGDQQEPHPHEAQDHTGAAVLAVNLGAQNLRPPLLRPHRVRDYEDLRGHPAGSGNGTVADVRTVGLGLGTAPQRSGG